MREVGQGGGGRCLPHPPPGGGLQGRDGRAGEGQTGQGSGGHHEDGRQEYRHARLRGHRLCRRMMAFRGGHENCPLEIVRNIYSVRRVLFGFFF